MKSIVFDMDGVLLDSESLVMECWEKTAQAHHVPHVLEICHRCLGVNAEETRQKFLEFYGLDFPYDVYKSEMSHRYWNGVQNGKLKLKPGAREMLATLHRNGWNVGIASSTRTIIIMQEMKKFGLDQLFHAIVGGDLVQHSKPNPEIYLAACKKMQILPEEAYAVEDSYNGIRAAFRAGMHPVMIPDLLPPTSEMEQLADMIFSNMNDFRKFLFNTDFCSGNSSI